MTQNEFLQRTALQIRAEIDAIPMEQLEALMRRLRPSLETDPWGWQCWVDEALGRYCYRRAANFIAGYEAAARGV